MTHDNAGSVPSRKLTAAPYISVSASTGPNGPMMASAPSRRPAAAPSENLRSQELAREMPLLVHSGPLPNFVSDSITCPTTAEQLCHQLLAWIGKYLILAFRGRGGGRVAALAGPRQLKQGSPLECLRSSSAARTSSITKLQPLPCSAKAYSRSSRECSLDSLAGMLVGGWPRGQQSEASVTALEGPPVHRG